MKEDSKNSKKKGTKNSKKIVINTKEDLNKLSFSVLKNTKILDFEGDYFNFIYERALGIEKNPEEKESLLSSNNFSTNKKNTKKVTSLKETKTAKIIKTVKKSSKKPSNKENNVSNTTKKKEENKVVNKNLNNDYFQHDDYNIYNSNYNNNDYNQSLPLPKIQYNQDISSVRKEFKVDYVIFEMKYNTRMGEDLGVIGSINQLGMWDQNKALKLKWHEGNIWNTTINYNFTQNSSFEFKFIFISNGQVKQWEDGSNRKLVYEELKQIIEPNIREGRSVEFKNINGNNIIYNYKDSSLTVVCDWNKK